MSAVFPKKAIFCLPVMIATLLLAPKLRPQDLALKPTIVQVERTPRGVAYRVDSKLTGSEPTNDLLHALNQVADRSGVSHPVVVFVDPRLPIEEIWNINGVASKAQLQNVRFFISFREDQKMTEIKWTPFVSFSTNPPAS